MKKVNLIFSIALILAGLLISTPSFAANSVQSQNHARLKKEFEQRLNLTDKQKEKAKTLHKQAREEMKPIIYKIELDKQEIEQLKQTQMAEKTKQEKINSINEDLRKLQKQAADIRKKNTQDFENILNKKQKEELAKMKAEGRARFERNHPPRPPFGGIGTPGLLMPRPLFAPNKN